jgi:tetratricopeptide (TPR) repeat protein
MKTKLAFCLFLILVLAGFVSAQGRPGGGGGGGGRSGGGTRPPSTNVPTNRPAPTLSQPMGLVFLSGKVTLDDGTQLTEAAAIQTICKGRRRTEAYTDSHGNFSFQLGGRAPANGAGVEDASTSPFDAMPTQNTQQTWQDCELQAVLPGFSSELVELSARMSGLETNDVGKIVLHRLEHVEGFTISATSAQAPKDARKAFEKGREHSKKGKWDEARQMFEKAVQIYPKYAVAWFELGRVQAQKQDRVGARQSFTHALEADEKYASPYNGLAQLAVLEKKWQELTELTSKLLALNPVSFPEAWLYNSVGNYYLHNFEAAEKSARQVLKLDDEHRLPKAEYLLGLILMQKHDYPGANEHIQQYLHVVTSATEIEECKKQLAEIARLSATAEIPAVIEKK